jgi:hypothetical protein
VISGDANGVHRLGWGFGDDRRRSVSGAPRKFRFPVPGSATFCAFAAISHFFLCVLFRVGDRQIQKIWSYQSSGKFLIYSAATHLRGEVAASVLIALGFIRREPCGPTSPLGP